MRSVDYVLFRSIQRSRAGYCLSLDCGLRGPFEDSPLPRRPPRAARSYSCSAPEAPPPLGAPTAARSCHRLEGWPPWAGPCFPELRRRVPRGGSRPAAAPPTRAPTRRFSDSSGSLTPPGHRPPHPAPPSPLLLPRSHSDPGITTSSDTGEQLAHPAPTKVQEGRYWEVEGQCCQRSGILSRSPRRKCESPLRQTLLQCSLPRKNNISIASWLKEQDLFFETQFYSSQLGPVRKP